MRKQRLLKKTKLQNEPQSINSVRPDVLDPVKQVSVRPKQYKVFADLPEHTQSKIMQINRWCKQQGIADNLEQRIGIALDYARTHPEHNTGRQGEDFIDNAGLKHKWSDVVAYAQHNIPMPIPERQTVNV
jgi:hypothetical protein